MKEPIRSGYALPGPQMASDEPTYDYAHLVKGRLVLKGSGENTHFDSHLPREGTVTRQIALKDWGADWLVLKFDEPFPYQFISVAHCLIRARWAGCPIGSDFCPVFVLTDPHNVLRTKRSWTSKDFNFDSWGEAVVIAQFK
jgi:hypothetical protein